MSQWRRKALEAFPEFARELSSEDVDSTYSLWREVMLPLVRDAHVKGDDQMLARIFGYASWSARQPAQPVWNAVGVSFYEHLFSVSRSDEWMERVVELVPDDVVQDVWALWTFALPDADARRLRAQLEQHRPALKSWLKGQS